ncbi:MAG TPA: hypothetical protein VF490_07170 [Chryseosolibacter sp.]
MITAVRPRLADLLKGQRLIVEFVGPPGSGKSTNCAAFTRHFSEQGLQVYQFADVKTYLKKMKARKRLYIYMETLLSRSSSLVSYLCVLLANGIRSFDSIIRYVKLCVFHTAALRFLEEKHADILFLDQWSIQGLWSATIFKNGNYEELRQHLPRFYLQPDWVLYFDASDETASERIRGRRSGRSRFDCMDDQERLSALKRYRQHLFEMFERSDCKNKLRLSTDVSPGRNAEDFFRHLTLKTVG